ncbi:MAG: aminomethyl-transferring glycine dehydrogenase subunit GcvPB [Armatimonadota bacterium]
MRLEPTIFELSSHGRTGVDLPISDVPESKIDKIIGADNIRSELQLPEVSQVDIIRHFTHLSSNNYGVDTGFYPLGSCTMKYNPKIDEEIASGPGWTHLHPYQSEEHVQGILGVLYDMQKILAEIGGMDAVTLQPAAGAQGELTALMIFKKHLERVGESHRRFVIVPDSSHGTNPATAARCGFEIMKVPSGKDGLVDMSALSSELSDEVAAVMLTNPNTLGLFEYHVSDICNMVHDAGALIYCDGANMNAVLSKTRPGDAGFDAMHFNLHKTFSSPHGGGGPGSGPVAIKAFLEQYLPVPTVGSHDGSYYLNYNHPETIGRMHTFYGNIGIILRAYLYIRTIGAEGLKKVSENAVLNANYLLHKTADSYDIPYGSRCMHEFIVSAAKQKAIGVKAFDIAKRLIDYGYHPPTIYFPLIVPEAMMIEPTETESIETLDAFADALSTIAKEAESDAQLVQTAPHTTVISRLDEATAARRPEVKWEKPGD